VSAAWYERTFTVPAHWAGRRLTLELEYLNSYAAVRVDDVPVGELRFPGGELDLTPVCRPGAEHRLSLLVVALPLKGVMLSYTDSASAREIKGSVARRGLCGDVYLVSGPRGARITDVRVQTSVRRGEFAINAELAGLAPEAVHTLRARISQDRRALHEWASQPFRASDLAGGRFEFATKWKPDRFWDIHTPTNTFDLELSLLDAGGKALDRAWTQRFGFREFWIDGRDFYLNGTRLYLSAVPLDNAAVSAGLATYDAARESLTRLQSFGINYVYTHNYGCEPGSHLGFAEILRAADDVGMLVGFSQPHFSHYEWKGADADRTNGYARHAEFYVRAAQNHPAVVMYAMSHNATGYNEDMNPDLIDGISAPRDTWASNNVRLALRAEAIVQRLDPSRLVYHHASGNLGALHAINFYPNFVPVQELSDWFEHWATVGVKPVFTCEYGAPFTWDWTMYRGWYNGQREFGSARVPWEFCLAEWNAQFFGDRAYPISEPEKTNLRWEARQFRAGNLWHRWDYPCEVGSSRFDERYPVFALYLNDNWRAFRTWGVSANSPWEHGHFWKLRAGVDRRRRDLPVDWDNLQRPGFSPDYVEQRYERMDLAFERADWLATPAAEALRRNNCPLLGYLAGKPARFTSKDHIFLPGEIVEKQLIVINNSRETVTCECQWSANLPGAAAAAQRVTVPTGEQSRLPVRLSLPVTLPAGAYEIQARFGFGTGETQQDNFPFVVLPATGKNGPDRPSTAASVNSEDRPLCVFDPQGETKALLNRWAVPFRTVGPTDELAAGDLLVVGKAALTVTGAAPDLRRVRDGLKVLLFEQTPDALEQRLGFRVAEYGLRQVFARVPEHPVLSGLPAEALRDWRGEATLVPARLKYEMRPRHGVTVSWCGLPVTRLWRCGNRGNVASALIEKPARGDFLPLLDGGYGLQYSPLLEYREGRGVVVLCQVDVTGRTETEPAAELLAHRLLAYVCAWKPAPRRAVLYAGEPAGRRHLESLGLAVGSLAGTDLQLDQVLVLGPGCREELAGRAAAIADWLRGGGHLLAIGLDQDTATALLPVPVVMRKAEHIATVFAPPGLNSLLAGIGPAEVHSRDPRELPLVTAGAQMLGNGVLAQAENVNVVFCQVVPWHFDASKPLNLKRTHRRVSVLVSRLMANLGAAGATPLLDRFSRPVEGSESQKEQRWLDGLYLDQPEEWDDPYRFFRW
jgi:hypothetical protein